MHSLILHGRRSLELQKWRNFRVSAKLLQIASSYSNSFSSVSSVHVNLQDDRKGKTFTVSYLVDSLGFTRKLAESISRKVISEGKGNPDSVLSLLKSYKFTESQISSIVVEMGFDPNSSKFIEALYAVYQLSDKTIEEKVNVYQSLGFTVGDVWEIFKKYPTILVISEKKILNSMETFLGLGFTRDEFATMVKCFPQCVAHSAELVKMKIEFVVDQMNWPVKSVALFPQVLGYSMEKRIVPRCNVIKALMNKRLLKSELPGISYVLAITDQVFLGRYVKKHHDKELVAELMAIFFTRDRVS
ncbi:unnamed protein product [Thlaspi arvense]|uniref:Uncharacterized protein n=1 Tax=Thlaspi arvense TaxID=13288 RepID=A0AAU9RW18_THLAR|nr:unnamed protein product [Thlaspi arvense]